MELSAYLTMQEIALDIPAYVLAVLQEDCVTNHLIYARQVLARMEEFVHLMTMTATHSDVSV